MLQYYKEKEKQLMDFVHSVLEKKPTLLLKKNINHILLLLLIANATLYHTL